MKPFEILSSLPQWTKLDQDAIVDSPAFAMPCRLGEENVTLLLGAVRPADAIRLSITIEDEPHVLSFARSPRFRELDAIWDGLADVPEPIVLALVEKDAGPVLQLVENAVRRKIRLVGLAESDAADAREFVAQIGGLDRVGAHAVEHHHQHHRAARRVPVGRGRTCYRRRKRCHADLGKNRSAKSLPCLHRYSAP